MHHSKEIFGKKNKEKVNLNRNVCPFGLVLPSSGHSAQWVTYKAPESTINIMVAEYCITKPPRETNSSLHPIFFCFSFFFFHSCLTSLPPPHPHPPKKKRKKKKKGDLYLMMKMAFTISNSSVINIKFKETRTQTDTQTHRHTHTHTYTHSHTHIPVLETVYSDRTEIGDISCVDALPAAHLHMQVMSGHAHQLVRALSWVMIWQ